MKILLVIIMALLNVNQHLNSCHLELFQSRDFELAIRGGANAGKTYSIADKLLFQPVVQPGVELKALVVRKTLPRLRTSTLEIIQKRAKLFGMPFNLNQNSMIARCGKMKWIFTSLNNKDDWDKIKSMTDIDFVWCNEVPELREDDYEMLLTRIRGGKGSFAQMITDFNPIGKTSWVFKRLYQKNIGNAKKLKYTILDNPWASKDEIKRLMATGKHNKNFYKIYFEGEWGELEGIIYQWDIACKTEGQKGMSWEEIINPDEIFYGGDFGYTVNPATLVRIYRKGNDFWVEEVFYETGLTNPGIAKLVIKAGAEEADSYWDAAEPKSIQELCDLGINAKPCDKGPDSVRAGIDFLISKNIYIIDGSENIVAEQKSYIRKQDKDGNNLTEPVKYMDHTLDGIRYGIFTHCRGEEGAFEMPDVGVRDIWG